jgi:hypothetical protein
MPTNNLGLFVPAMGVDDFTLPVNHFVQNDNTGGEGYRECFGTSCAMLADYCLKGELRERKELEGHREPEDLYFSILAKYGDTTDPNANLKALEELGLDCYFSTSASLEDVSHSLYRGIPVVVGNGYKASGHMTLVNGRDPNGFDVLCPYGIRAGSSNSWHQIFRVASDAQQDHFSWSVLKRVFTDLGDEAGWALFTTAVRGVSTGVKAGM